MLNFPQSTELSKLMPKNKLYEKANISNTLKDAFVKEVEQITWVNKLSPETLNISASDNIKEIEVFHIKLRTPDYNPKILEVIDNSIPYYILYVLEYDNLYQLKMAYKEKTPSGNNQAKAIKYFSKEWAKNPTLDLFGNKLDTIYEHFLEQLSDNIIKSATDIDIKAQVAKSQQIDTLEKEIEKLTKKMLAEKQFNRQLEIKNKIRQLQSQLNELKGLIHG